MGKNYALELYKLIMYPNEDRKGISYVNEFGWVNSSEFLVWIDYRYMKEFMDKIADIFGYGIFDDGNFNANMQSDCACIDLKEVLDGYIDIEEAFPIDKYKH